VTSPQAATRAQDAEMPGALLLSPGAPYGQARCTFKYVGAPGDPQVHLEIKKAHLPGAPVHLQVHLGVPTPPQAHLFRLRSETRRACRAPTSATGVASSLILKFSPPRGCTATSIALTRPTSPCESNKGSSSDSSRYRWPSRRRRLICSSQFGALQHTAHSTSWPRPSSVLFSTQHTAQAGRSWA
jgi:hypothetical protein